MPRTRRDFLEIAKTGINFSAGYIYEEFLFTLRGVKGIKTYREMRENDPIMGAVAHAITQILRESRWSVQKNEHGSQEDADFLEDCRVSMTHSCSEFIMNVLSMITYGWSWFEVVYRRRSDNKIGWKKFAPRVQTSLEKWELDDVSELVGMWQRPPPDYTSRFLPLEKSLHFQTEPASGNPEGRSIFRNAFRPWYFKKGLEEIEAIGIERDLTALALIKLPEGVDPNSDDPEVQAQITAAKRLVKSVRRDEQDGIVLPSGWEFELVSFGQRQFDTTAVINQYNKEIAVTSLAQFVMLGMERTGSYALAKEQTDMFYLCLEGWLDDVGTNINRHAVPKLFAWNGITNRPLPYLVHTPVRKMSLKELADYVARLAGEKVSAVEVTDDLKGFLTKYARLSEFSEVRR